jgi:predicted DNA-binding transcriptional regulator AlpA
MSKRNKPTTTTTSPGTGREVGLANRLAFKTDEACAALGGISKPTLWRLEKRELLKPSRALRTPLWSRAEIERYLEQTK